MGIYRQLSATITSTTKKHVKSFHDASARNSNYYNSQPTRNFSINTLNTLSDHPLTIKGRIGSLSLTFLIDTGSTITLINSKVFNQLSPRLTQFCQQPSTTLSLRLANQAPLRIQWVLQLPFSFNNTTRWHTTYVAPDLWRQCILGYDFIRKHKICIDGAQQKIYFAHRQKFYQHKQTIPDRASNTDNRIQRYLQDDSMNSTIIHDISHTKEETKIIDSILSNDQQNQLNTLIRSFPNVFTNKPGRTTKLQHHIEVEAGNKPRNSAPYRYAPARRQIIDEQIDEMLNEGVIVPSKSPWASPVVLVQKKDGTTRFCIDYRKLNEITIRDAYPIPRIDDTLDDLQHAQFLSTLDLRSGYWQVAMDEKSKSLTAFITHRGLFECTVMPFGLTNAPATFQRLMDIVLAGLKWKCCLVYLDDIIVYSTTFEQHLQDLRNVFIALAEANLTLKATKCNFCRREMKYLGHIITSDGIKPDPALIETVVKFEIPQKIKDVQAFLGLTGYYRRFVQNYAKIAEPLHKLLRFTQKTTPKNSLDWNMDCTTAFNKLKQCLTSPPIMQSPNFAYPFILELDACEYGIGCVLTQEIDKKKHVIAYASRTLSTPERKYSAVEREALAIVWATNHFRQYIEGGPVIVRSDCKALEWLKKARDPTSRLARWAMKISPYHIIIQHRPGTSNANGDFMSRYPIESNEPNSVELNSIEAGLNILEGTNLLDNIYNEQRTDPRLEKIIQSLISNPTVPFNIKHTSYVLINNLLYKVRHYNTYTNQRLLGNKHLLVIPKTLQNMILQWAHNHPTAGHAGRLKTMHRLSSKVFWPKMRKDVFKYVQSCIPCQQFKYSNSQTAAPMQLHTVSHPWHTIGIDIMGPFPPTFRQKRFLLVIVDYFTRWVELFALRETTATHISNIIIDEIICRYGIPLYILSDNGPQFVSNLFNGICTALGIARKFTANYHPQSNMTERVNRNLKTQIAIYAQNHPGSWDKDLQKLAFAIRTSINESTGDTPAFLNFGRDPIVPLDLMINTPKPTIPTNTPEQKFIIEYRQNLINSLRNTYNLVQEHSEIKKLLQKQQYDKHTVNRNFLVGDLVWVELPNPQIGNTTISHKLRPKYQGPCRLIEQVSPSTFIVLRIKDNVNIGTTNVDRMKLYYEPQDDTPIISNRSNNVSLATTRRYPLRKRNPTRFY